MSWLITAKQYIPAVIGEPFGGGYFAGYISHTANGNQTHALIVAPKSVETTSTGETPSAANSSFDGRLNTDTMIALGITAYPAADYCVNLTANGFTDWYLPSRFEHDIAYFNLKPTAANNDISFGINQYSVPIRGSNYRLTYPTTTGASNFVSTGGESFDATYYWSSTNIGASGTARLSYADGNVSFGVGINPVRRVRAFRRIAL
jgi:hypothetical protein